MEEKTTTENQNQAPTEAEQQLAEATQKLADQQTALDALQAKLVEAETAKQANATLTERLTVGQAAVAALHQEALLAGLIDPALKALAPAVELDDQWHPKPESLDAVKSWREGKPHFFAQAATSSTKPVPTPKPGGESVVDRSYWERMRKEQPELWAQPEIQRKHSDWVVKQTNTR